MGKKGKNSKMFDQEQVHKKHRGKSAKLEKRENVKKNRKTVRKELHAKKDIKKFVKKIFKSNRIECKIEDIEFELKDVKKRVKKLIQIDSSASEIPEFFASLEDNPEIDLSEMENEGVQKQMVKLLKTLNFSQNPHNIFTFKYLQKLPLRYLSFIMKAIFEYVEQENIPNETNKEENEDSYNEENSEMNKQELDYEYEMMEQDIGKNAELINKAYTKILNSKDKEEPKLTEEQTFGPPVPEFLASTLNLLGAGEEDDKGEEKDELCEFLGKNTYVKEKKQKAKKIEKEPINKDSYNQLVNIQKAKMLQMEKEIEDYESQFRGTSLLEQHQQKNEEEQK